MLSLISESLLIIFLVAIAYQGRMVRLEQQGYARNPGQRDMNRMRERLEELLKLN